VQEIAKEVGAGL